MNICSIDKDMKELKYEKKIIGMSLEESERHKMSYLLTGHVQCTHVKQADMSNTVKAKERHI